MPGYRKKSKKAVKRFEGSYLFDLDDDLLATIFKFLPDVKTVNLVCKKFHKIAVSMVAGKEWLWIKNEADIDDEQMFSSMMKCKRVLRNAAVGESSAIKAIDYQDVSDDFLCEKWYFEAAKSVIGIEHGKNITQLQLMNIQLPIGKLADLLSFIVNLKSLFLYFVNQHEDGKQNVPRVYKDEPLPRITDVVIYECGDSVFKLLDQLPADSIKSLTAKANNFEVLKETLKRQRSTRKLNLMSDDDEPLTEDFFEYLFDLTHLSLTVKKMKNLPAIIDRIPDLISLNVNGMKITGSALKNCVVSRGSSSAVQDAPPPEMSQSCMF